MNTKVILINGFAGSGKTTIAKMYIDNHPLAMVIEGDELIVNVGDWLNNEDQARDLVFEITKKMLETALRFGHDVIVPYLVLDAAKVTELEQIASKFKARFYEFYLAIPKEHAVERLLKRATWGEAGTPPISTTDIPVITQLYDRMESALPSRTNQIHIQIKEGGPIDTYQGILGHVR